MYAGRLTIILYSVVNRAPDLWTLLTGALRGAFEVRRISSCEEELY